MALRVNLRKQHRKADMPEGNAFGECEPFTDSAGIGGVNCSMLWFIPNVLSIQCVVSTHGEKSVVFPGC